MDYRSATIDDPFLYVSKFGGYLSMHIILLLAKNAEDYVSNAYIWNILIDFGAMLSWGKM